MLEVLAAIDPLTLAAFMAASVALYLTPGIDMLFTLACGARGGRSAGVAAGLGVSLGSLFHTVIAVLGVAALLRSSEPAYDALRLTGAVYLGWLAVTAWRSPPPDPHRTARTPMRSAFMRGALGNMLNPKVSLFILAFLPQFTDPAIGPVWMQLTILGLMFSLGSVPFLVAFGLFAGTLSDRMLRRGRLMNRVSAVVFGGLAARLVLD